MADSEENQARKEGKKSGRASLASLGLAGVLGVGASFLPGLGQRAQAAIYGSTSLSPATTNVVSGSSFFMDLLQATYTNVSGGSYRFKVSDTNTVYPTGLTFFQDESNNITNGFHTGKTVVTGSSGLYDEGEGTFRVGLTISGGYSTGTGVVARVFFNANNPLSNPVNASITNVYDSVNRSGGTWNTGAGTWAKTNTIDVALGGNPSPWTDVVVNPPVPEPATAALLFVGGLTAFLRRKRKK